MGRVSRKMMKYRQYRDDLRRMQSLLYCVSDKVENCTHSEQLTPTISYWTAAEIASYRLTPFAVIVNRYLHCDALGSIGAAAIDLDVQLPLPIQAEWFLPRGRR